MRVIAIFIFLLLLVRLQLRVQLWVHKLNVKYVREMILLVSQFASKESMDLTAILATNSATLATDLSKQIASLAQQTKL